MPDILHRLAIKASPSDTYAALATIDGLARWWTTDTRGTSEVGGVINFRFGERGFIDSRVIELVPDTRVLWEVIDGPDAWHGTWIRFELSQQDDHTIVLFKHQGWAEAIEFMHHCSTKWATFLMSLKAALETGTGAPYPDDMHISNKGD